MPIVGTREMLRQAQAGQYAVGAFNIENMEMAQAVVAAAEEQGAPVILQTTPGTLRYASPALFAAMVAGLAGESPVPVALHLDHGDSCDLAARAIQCGYTSVMIDGSAESFERNIALTRHVVDAAGPRSLPVEAELGQVGGKEDDAEGPAGGYTDPAQAREFVRRTGIDSLAVAIGTAHGLYASAPRLDIDRLRAIRRLVDVPLVLHGASGLTDADIAACIAEGICKVNFATELRIAFTGGVRQALADRPDAFDPKAFGAQGRERVKRLVMDRIRVCGCHSPL